MCNKSFTKCIKSLLTFSVPIFFVSVSLSTSRPKSNECGTELSVINCMSPIDSASKPKINETQLMPTVKNDDNNKLNYENQNETN